ncbi:MAG: lysylphosphatidylglycerol synthase domain-containing protein [Nitriliruptoraceae bacterium]
MHRSSLAPTSRKRRLVSTVGVVATVVAIIWLVRTVEATALADVWSTAMAAPATALLVVAAYGSAFVLRAIAWTRIVPSLGFGHSLAALHVSLGANHVLPARLGEVLRVASVAHRAGVPMPVATASTVVLRAADVATIVALAVLLAPAVAADVVGRWAAVLLAAAVAAAVTASWWLARMRQREQIDVRSRDAFAFVLVVASWLLEATVIHQAAAWAGVPLTATEAIVVTAVTIAAQAVAVAPGGFGTYEAAATAALVAIGATDAATALVVAIAAHAFKTAYSLVTGAIASFVPAPSMLGWMAHVRAHAPTPAPMTAPSTAGSSG